MGYYILVFLKLGFRVRFGQKIRLGFLYLIFLWFLALTSSLNNPLYFIFCLLGFTMIIDFNSIRHNIFFDISNINTLPISRIKGMSFLISQELFGYKFLFFITTLVFQIILNDIPSCLSISWIFFVYNIFILMVFFLVKRFAIASIVFKNLLSLIAMLFLMTVLFIYLEKSKMVVVADYINSGKNYYLINMFLIFITTFSTFSVFYLSRIKPFIKGKIVKSYNKKYWY
tara:strand:- start:5579 stop:6262 length:684 start_codon:yes stop_codon:yes gene_type:complete